MARHYGVRVTVYNVSHEQVLYARERAAREGLRDRVIFIEDDYRSARGRFDAFVSVGMLEHVGRRNGSTNWLRSYDGLFRATAAAVFCTSSGAMRRGR